MNGTKDDRDDGECWIRQMFALYDNNIFIRLGRNFCFAACHLNIAMFGVMASMFVTNNQIICMVNDNTNEKQYQSHFQDSLHHFSIISFAYWELCYVRCMQQAFIFCGCHCYGNSIIRFQVHLYLYSIRIGFFLPLASSLRAGAVFEQFFFHLLHIEYVNQLVIISRVLHNTFINDIISNRQHSIAYSNSLFGDEYQQ